MDSACFADWPSVLVVPSLLPGFRDLHARGLGALPSIFSLMRVYRIRAAWPLEMPSCKAMRFQSICVLIAAG